MGNFDFDGIFSPMNNYESGHHHLTTGKITENRWVWLRSRMLNGTLK